MKKIISTGILVCSLLVSACDNGSNDKKSSEKIESTPETQSPTAIITTPGSVENPYINLSAIPVSDAKLKFSVETNMPLPVEVMASVSLKGQKGDDVYIGYSTRQTIQKATQTLILDTSNEALPAGDYTAEISFYPRWGAKNGNPDAAKIKNVIYSSSDIHIQGSGQSVQEVIRKNQLQKWVIENVVIGTRWDESNFAETLGEYENFIITNRNPKIITGYYFGDADMTIFINLLKNNVVTWKFGKTSSL